MLNAAIQPTYRDVVTRKRRSRRARAFAAPRILRFDGMILIGQVVRFGDDMFFATPCKVTPTPGQEVWLAEAGGLNASGRSFRVRNIKSESIDNKTQHWVRLSQNH